jgi:hypothetical protein
MKCSYLWVEQRQREPLPKRKKHIIKHFFILHVIVYYTMSCMNNYLNNVIDRVAQIVKVKENLGKVY